MFIEVEWVIFQQTIFFYYWGWLISCKDMSLFKGWCAPKCHMCACQLHGRYVSIVHPAGPFRRHWTDTVADVIEAPQADSRWVASTRLNKSPIFHIPFRSINVCHSYDSDIQDDKISHWIPVILLYHQVCQNDFLCTWEIFHLVFEYQDYHNTIVFSVEFATWGYSWGMFDYHPPQIPNRQPLHFC